MKPPFSLYIHIPFCIKKCPYCDFTTYATPKVPEGEYLQNIKDELSLYANDPEFQGREIQTIFFGGGTPSLLAPAHIQAILNHAEQCFSYANQDPEITLEANPVHLTKNALKGFRAAGVSRISLGAQSLEPRVLDLLGRDHTREDIINSVAIAKHSGFQNINLDLIFGVPGSDLLELQRDIQAFEELNVPHISTYNLTIEKGTPFYQAVANGVFHVLSEDECGDQYELIQTQFSQAGFLQYEVSNFSRPEYECRHNLHYWHRDDYLGIGVGAHSFIGSDSKQPSVRWANTASLKEYDSRLRTKKLPIAWREKLSQEDEITEVIMLGLRLSSGLDMGKLQGVLDATSFERISENLQSLSSSGFGEGDSTKFRLTSRGLASADAITGELLRLLAIRKEK